MYCVENKIQFWEFPKVKALLKVYYCFPKREHHLLSILYPGETVTQVTLTHSFLGSNPRGTAIMQVKVIVAINLIFLSIEI